MATRLDRMTSGIPKAALETPDPPKAAPAAPTRLEARMGTIARGEDVVLPILGDAYIQLLGHEASSAIEAATFEAMAKVGLPPTTMNAFAYDMNRHARIFALAVRDPDDHSKPFGSLAGWLKLDDDMLVACSLVYADVRDRLDPMGSRAALDGATMNEINDAFEKKNAKQLQSFGVAQLSLWLLTSGVQLSTSPTPPSTDGQSSSEPTTADSTSPG